MALSRRDFLSTSALACGSTLLPMQAPAQTPTPASLSVATVLDRMKQHLGVPWRTPTVDRLIVGTDNAQVHGIATTMMTTFEVCKRAQAAGANLLITHEPTFFKHEDTVDDLRDNPVLQAKQAFLAKHGMAIFRFHDNLHSMHPDGVAKGMLQQLGWQGYATTPDLKRLNFNGMPLAQIANQLATKLHGQSLRVVGDPNLPIHRAAANWGYSSRESGLATLADPSVDLLLCGEAREWEVVEYAQDAITAGQKKALIVINHVLSEQGGMIFVADWLEGFIPEVPVTFVPTPEPFWRPDASPLPCT